MVLVTKTGNTRNGLGLEGREIIRVILDMSHLRCLKKRRKKCQEATRYVFLGSTYREVVTKAREVGETTE